MILRIIIDHSIISDAAPNCGVTSSVTIVTYDHNMFIVMATQVFEAMMTNPEMSVSGEQKKERKERKTKKAYRDQSNVIKMFL
jgi:hypothetical protein